MIKFLLSFSSVVLTTSVLFAQHFAFQPDRLHEETVSFQEYSNHIIFMENLTGGELILGWEKISVDFPATWQADLCDYVGCYLGIPESGTMSPVYDTIQGFLKLSINPNNTPGTGTAVFRVFDNKHPEESDTCTFIIHATELTSIAETATNDILKVYPIPAGDYIYAGHSLDRACTVTVFDVQGVQQAQQILPEKRNSKISLRGLPSGVYVIVLSDNREILERKRILIL